MLQFCDVQRRSLETRYYDTATLSLAAQGLSLRLRRSGDDPVVQTIKRAAPPDRPFERLELEQEIPGNTPDPAPLSDLMPPEAFEAILADGLRPAFETNFERTAGEVAQDDAQVEIALDLGAIEAAGGARPIAEVEAELKSGPTVALYDAALRLIECGAGGLMVESKASRAARLADGTPPPVARAKAIRFQPDITVGAAFADIARNCMGQWAANYPNLMETGEMDAIHQTRVAIRRIRAAVWTYKGVIDQQAVSRDLAGLKAFFGDLGGIRDIDVLVEETLPRQAAHGLDPTQLNRAVAVLRAERARRWKALAKDVMTPAHTAIYIRLARWLEAEDWRQVDDPLLRLWHDRPLKDFAETRLDKVARRVRKAAKRAEAGDIHDWHALRIVLKRLRYACEFFQSLYPGETAGPYVKALKSLQDELGMLNDMEVATSLLQAEARRRKGAQATALTVVAAYCRGFLAGTERAEIERLTERWRALKATPPFWREARP